MSTKAAFQKITGEKSYGQNRKFITTEVTMINKIFAN